MGSSHLQIAWWLLPGVLRNAQAVAELSLQLGLSQELGQHIQWLALTGTGAPPRAASEEDSPKGQTGQAPEPCLKESCSIESVLHQPVLTTNQLKGLSLPSMCKQQPKFNYNRRAHTQGTHLEYLGQVIREDCATGPNRTPST